MEKNMKVSITHIYVSPTPRIDIIQVNFFSVKLLVKMSAIFSTDQHYYNDIACSCTNLLMQCMCISMCLVLYICTRSVEIFLSVLLSHQMIVGESNANPSSPRIPCKHTHFLVVFISPLYSDSTEDKEIMCCLRKKQDHVKA